MDITIKAALVAAIVTVVLGVAFDVFRVWWRERAVKQRVRTIAKVEIDHNLKLLEGFWNPMLQVKPTTVKADFQILPEVRKLMELPLPVWSHKVWESQLAMVASSLKEEEIKQVHLFHTQLAAITSILNKLLALDAEHERGWATSNNESALYNPKVYGFYHNGPVLVEEIKAIVEELKKTENPLGDSQSTQKSNVID